MSARPARIHTAPHLNSRLSKVGFKSNKKTNNLDLMALLSGYRGGSLKFFEFGSLISKVEGVLGVYKLGTAKIGDLKNFLGW